MRLDLKRVTVALDPPFSSAGGTLHERELVLVALEARDGLIGWGESAPLGVAVAEVLAALEAYRPVLADGDAVSQPELVAACSRVRALPEALAAIDLALWDLTGRRAGVPVWRLLGASAPRPIELNATIASADRAGAAAAAAQTARAGFRCLKVKVGLGDDAGRLAAVRAAAGPELALRLDAGGAWSVAEAAAALRTLAPAGIELCEEPVHGLEAIAELTAASDIPLSIDETGHEPGALTHRACTAVCLKIARRGGIGPTLEAAYQARAAGYEVYLASLLDGPLGIAAALHVAAVLTPDRACGLATLDRFAGRRNPLPPRAGTLAPPSSAGLGEDLPAWYA